MERSGSSFGDGRAVSVHVPHLFRELMTYMSNGHVGLARLLARNFTPEIREVVSRRTDYTNYDGTLLMTALRRRKTAFVELLLEEGCADTEEQFRDSYGGKMMRMTPLCWAARKNYVNAVHALVRHGADINAPSAEITPVHAACFRKNVDMDTVKYLVENGADINRPDYRGGTCLMDSVNNVELCRFLIEQHATVNAAEIDGDSALHYAIYEKRIDTCQLLMGHGADPLMTNREGDNALQSAAVCDAPDIVEYLIQEMNPSPERRADIYSLLAATIVSNEDVERALPYWVQSTNIRMEAELSADPNVSPNAAYNFAVEATDIDSVMNIADNVDALNMQALVVRERVLGREHRQTILGVLYMAADYAYLGDYHRCLDLFKYALRNFRLNLTRRGSDYFVYALRELYNVLWTIRNANPAGIHFGDLSDMLACMINKTCKSISSVTTCSTQQAILPAIALRLVHLLCSLTLTEAETSTFRQLVRALVQTDFRTEYGCILHAAVHPSAYMYVRLNNVPSAQVDQSNQPSSAVVECLLRAGAAVNEVDSNGNTPLHLAVFYPPETTDEQKKLVDLLLHHGAHVDVANNLRRVPSDKLPANVVFSRVSLACLAARTVRVHKIPYRGIVPKMIADFVDFH